MTTPISITTRQTEELIRKWQKANKTNQTLFTAVIILWALIAIARIIMGIAHPNDWLNWVNAGLAATVVLLYIFSHYFPHLAFPMMTTTVTFADQTVSIFTDKKGKTHSYSVDWNKVYIHESSDCYFFQVNFRRMQIFRKEDLTDCTTEELSALLRKKLDTRYVKL